MFTVPGAIRSFAFTRSGTHLIAGNDSGTLVIFDLNRGGAVDVVQTC